uniref:Dynactin subunit 5 n=1 Tax=Bicosoecida sp. CB-2014 TaxID=1486930 RepID=A0A7S1CBR5_9STRA|mmetsp:Transcript_19114/g.67508  ORF Transcript_19114/g.67508 Transcript_19114/m.67508 type:complete len:185 (+) Transcript_19114:170-724(+)
MAAAGGSAAPASASGYVVTTRGNRVSRAAHLAGSQFIKLQGKSILRSGVVVRGDLAPVSIGRYCHLADNCVVRPSYKRFASGFKFIPVSVGDYTSVGEGAVVCAAALGACVSVGAGAVVGARAIIKDCCVVEAGAVVAADAVVPPFTRVAGVPARAVGELREGWGEQATEEARARFDALSKVLV